MKKTLIALCCSLCLIAFSVNAETIRVACVGNSITYGHGIKNRNTDSYPAVLGQLLGTGWDVKNFGVSGRTLLSKGDNPYIKEKAYLDALTFNPNVVIIKLGTNDSKPQNWKFEQEFETDLKALILSFERLPAKPIVYLCFPAKAYGTRYNINDSIIANGVIPHIKKVASKTRSTVIDLYRETENMEANFPDMIHPNEAGARIMANKVATVLKKNKKLKKLHGKSNL